MKENSDDDEADDMKKTFGGLNETSWQPDWFVLHKTNHCESNDALFPLMLGFSRGGRPVNSVLFIGMQLIVVSHGVQKLNRV